MGLSLLMLASAFPALAAQPDADPGCQPVIESPWVRAAPPGAASLAGYLVLRNPCDAPVEVVDVESLDFGMPMIHRTVDVARVRLVLADGRRLFAEFPVRRPAP